MPTPTPESPTPQYTPEEVVAALHIVTADLLDSGFPEHAAVLNWLAAHWPDVARDAARFQWLREHAERIQGHGIDWHYMDEHRPHPPMQDLDSAIDGARAQQKGQT